MSESPNIAEGHARQGREFAHFLSIAKGSLAEVESQLLLSVELAFLDQHEVEPILGLATELHRMLAILGSKVAHPCPHLITDAAIRSRCRRPHASPDCERIHIEEDGESLR